MVELNIILARASEILEVLDTPVSLGAWLRIKHKAYREIVNMTIDPLHYTERDEAKFCLDYQAVELLRKFPDLPTEYDLDKVATSTFFECERQCALTNRRLHLDLLDFEHGTTSRLKPFWTRARGFVRRVLGDIPDFLVGRFGPGVSFESYSGGRSPLRSTISDKVSGPWGITSGVRELLTHELYRADRHYDDYFVPTMEVPGNRFASVPKDAKTNRGVCPEPGGNLYLQLGVGSVLRERLLKCGLDLRHGQATHHRVLRCNWRNLATIDLSSASDTVSRRLVQLLLPEDWHHLLDTLRSKRTLIEGQWVYLEKFSSMGNGFTFELETLLFAALVYAAAGGVPGRDYWVYGDDIIVDRRHFTAVTALLKVAGFTTNSRKSYGDGLFRESCGLNLFNGKAVEPVRIKETPSTPVGWITLSNRLYHIDGRHSRLLVNMIPKAFRSRVPRSLGHRGLWDDDSRRWSIKVVDGIRLVKVVLEEPKRYLPLKRWYSKVQLASALFGASSKGYQTDVRVCTSWASVS